MRETSFLSLSGLSMNMTIELIHNYYKASEEGASWCSYDGHTLYGVLKIILKNLLPPILECMYIRYNTCYLRSLLK